MIIFPAIDLRNGRCVRLVQGQPDAETVYSDDPVATAQRWTGQGAAWLHLVNLDGAFGAGESSRLNLAAIADILQVIDVPVQLGGGLRTQDDVALVLSLGVTRVIIGTAALSDPGFVGDLVTQYGPDRVAVALDVRDGRVATHGWQQVSDRTAVEVAGTMKQHGLERVIYTDISRDGMLAGANVEACALLARETGLEVIVSGGVASLEDIRRVKARAGEGVEGVIVGQALYTGRVDLAEALKIAGPQASETDSLQ